jgi:hypothetical protein
MSNEILDRRAPEWFNTRMNNKRNTTTDRRTNVVPVEQEQRTFIRRQTATGFDGIWIEVTHAPIFPPIRKETN